MISETKAYLVGGGIGSLAAAAFMIRDGNIPGANISILEAAPIMGEVWTAPETQSVGTQRPWSRRSSDL